MSTTNPRGFRSVLVTGGGGYVGSALVPELLQEGYRVKVLDLFWYGQGVFGENLGHPNLELVKLDIRNSRRVSEELRGIDVVIHLACISNDPSFELDPDLGKTINYDAFAGLLQGAIDRGVRRFIYASSSSVYGVKEEPDVREDAEPLPLTDYSKFKLACERDLLAHRSPNGMERVILRPATVCGYAPRLRLDLTVNILTMHGLVNRKIRIFGGKQLRPNLNIKDTVRAYQLFLNAPGDKIDRQTFNVGYQNRSVEDLAHTVRETLEDPSIELEYVPTEDNRSYHVNSDKIHSVLGFKAEYTIEDAVLSIAEAYRKGLISDPLGNPLYSNIKRMQQLRAR
jgi:nucleoside-diphosphate-sugar epimerase